MKYMLLIYGEEGQPAPEPGTPAFDAYLAPWMEYTEALQKAGVYLGGEPLEESHTASCVKVRDGKRTVQDGPFADSKEQLGGYYMVDVETLDQAIEWAAKCPGAQFGTMEVRPLMHIPGMDG